MIHGIHGNAADMRPPPQPPHPARAPHPLGSQDVALAPAVICEHRGAARPVGIVLDRANARGAPRLPALEVDARVDPFFPPPGVPDRETPLFFSPAGAFDVLPQ